MLSKLATQLALVWVVVMAGTQWTCAAAADERATPPAGSAAPVPLLFEDSATLRLTLEFPLRELRSGKRLEQPLAGTVSFTAGGVEKHLDVEVMNRGHSRLELCDMPPLKLDFQRKQVKGTPFAGQNKLKLVTHCMARLRYYRYVRHEYALYRSYAALTDSAFRARMLEVTYRDSDGRRSDKTYPAFLIESDREVAARLGFEEATRSRVSDSDLDPDAITLFALFQFMVGNTDWSLRKGPGDEPCCHNGLLLEKPDGRHVIVPYDFDQAGLVDAEYAIPAKGLGIRNVRQRVFRGLCTGDARLIAAIDRLNARRGQIEAEFAQAESMKRADGRALRYIEEFYRIVNDPRERQEWIGEECRGSPGAW